MMSLLKRKQRLYLVPVGPEHEHLRTLDGKLPGNANPTVKTTGMLPCWGVTDGNILVRSGGAEPGDVLAFIRAQSKGHPATVHRLAILSSMTRDAEAASQLYKEQHSYHMGKVQRSMAGVLEHIPAGSNLK